MYGSTQIELAWTVIPILIMVVLFLATARVIHAIQDAPKPEAAVEVTAIGHQFWWEFRYPALDVVTANELHIPVSDPAHPTPTVLRLLSARPSVQRLGRLLSHPAFCWLAASAALVGWHVPAAFTLALQSETWHVVEHSCFLVAGFLSGGP